MAKPAPKQMHCDVAVIGAGAAGIAAAIAAANAGADVMLIERHALTGGLATSAWVGTLCGLHYRSLQGARFAVQGFARTFAEAVQCNSQSEASTFGEGLHFIPYQPAAFHETARQALQAAGVRLALKTTLTAVHISAGRIHCLALQSSEQELELHSTTVVDCSGHAQVSLLAGIPRLEDSEYQAGALVFQVSGLPDLAARVLSLELLRWLQRGIQAGILAPECERLSIVPGARQNGLTLLKLGMPPPVELSASTLSDYENSARQRSLVIINYLRQHEPALSQLKITASAPAIGIRSSERSVGLVCLDETHILNCAKPNDGVAIGAWPMEYWGSTRKPTMGYFALDDYYLLSAGMLVSRHLQNLFFAGRNLSATAGAIASARVIGTCLQTGYAAGCLAAASSECGQWQQVIPTIRQQQIFAG